MQLTFWSSILEQIIIHSFCLFVLAAISKLILLCMGQLLTVNILLMIVLRELWNVTKVRETTIIINKVIYRKKKKRVSWANIIQGPLMMTTYVYKKMKRKQKKSCSCLALKTYLAQFTSLVWGFYIPKINYHFNHCFF